MKKDIMIDINLREIKTQLLHMKNNVEKYSESILSEVEALELRIKKLEDE